MTRFEAGGALNNEEHHDIIIVRPELYDVIKHIEREDLYVALGSPRQTGKTTLLYQIQDRMQKNNFEVAIIDLEGMNDLSKDAFYLSICADILHELGNRVSNSAIIELNPERIDNQDAFLKFLKTLSKGTPGVRKLILAFDEIGGVPDEVYPTFFPTLRKFFGRGRKTSSDRDFYRKVMFVFAGGIEMQRLMQGRSSPIRNVCRSFCLKDFNNEHTLKLANNLKDYPTQYAEAAGNCVSDWCNGHPYLTQYLLGLLDESNYCWREGNENIYRKVEELVNRYIIHGDNPNLTHIRNHLRDNKNYRDQVFMILERGSRKSIPYKEELLALGIIKRSEDLQLNIRNRIYERALKNILHDFKHLPPWVQHPQDNPQADEVVHNASVKESVLESPAALKTVRIFLASSEELAKDRDAFDLYFRQQNDYLRKEGLYLKIIRWENFIDAMSDTRLQDEYSDAVRRCDIFVSLFSTKAGKYTEEEFDVAFQTYKATKKRPRVYTFFKRTQIDTVNADKEALMSFWAFQEKLKQLGHFYTQYNDIEHLKRQFSDQLQKLRVEDKLPTS